MPDLSTRNARKRLKARSAPYWQKLAVGRALGYMATAGSRRAGRWQVRLAAGGTSSGYRFRALGAADDLPHVPADGEDVLTYQDALAAAAAWDPWAPDDGSDEPTGPLDTVADVMAAYLAWADEHRKSAASMRTEAKAHILPELGEVPVAKLTAARIRAWHEALAKKPARIRSAKDGEQRTKPKPRTDEEKRARRATANRILTILKAALNRAWTEEQITCEPVWKRVTPFRNVERSRARYLDPEEIKRLLNAIDEPQFRDLVAGAVYTGARYQELARLHVEDVHLDSGSVVIRTSKAGKARAVYLNDEAVSLFESLTAGRAPSDHVFLKPDATPWGKSQTRDRLLAACKAAEIDPPITFHGLRHSYASLYLMAGGGLADLAKQLGHATTAMVQRHYGHLADSWRAERARQFAPSLGIEPGNVRQLGKRTRTKGRR